MVKVARGELAAFIPSTGVVTPRNRLEIKPPFAGRIERVLVKEGANVRKGQVLAWISSSDRAALLDAARAKGAAEIEYWEDVYKPAPVIAPINGFIVLSNFEPGQSFTAADPIMVMADKLIVKAQVDETDIGKIKAGQGAMIVLDAYPDQKTEAAVESIEYESQVINNVTIYQVYVLPDAVPAYFRSGMSATVNFAQRSERSVLLLPLKAVRKQNGQSYVFVRDKDDQLQPKRVTTGQDNGSDVGILSGLSEGDEVTVPDAATATALLARPRRGGLFNPFGGRRSR
ncbi:MAG: efflux RND transporter periplasmic adaptor subunit [Candidatus Saganbacteria bacterium]|nr:efflux RND transporter periplasmic adaptor subunit [Candidatus Saganbacteria bacterium]